MSEAEQTTDDRDEIIRKLKEENEKLKVNLGTSCAQIHSFLHRFI